MPFEFPSEKLERNRRKHLDWWAKKGIQPILGFAVKNKPPSGDCPAAPLLSQAVAGELQYTPEQLADRIYWELCQYSYYGDLLPFLNLASYGPGSLAAMLGANLKVHDERVWFDVDEVKPIEELTLKYDPENFWVKRIKALYKACNERFEGKVMLGLPDLGGVLDVIATFRTSENLLTDLYDSPDEVLRLVSEGQNAWYDAYFDLAKAAHSEENGYTNWSLVYSDMPAYITQCDFCYMISPRHFDRFVFDTLKTDCDRLTNVIYHLDGDGQIPFADRILSIKKLDAVQWVPGDGKPPQCAYGDLMKKIADAGKSFHLTGIRPGGRGLENFEYFYDRFDRGRLCVGFGANALPASDGDFAKDILKKYGIPL